MSRVRRPPITLTDAERTRLTSLAAHPQTRQKHARRARIILCLDAGYGPTETQRRTAACQSTVWRWWDRFLAAGVDGLLSDATRPPGKAPVPEDTVQALITRAMSPPPANRSHWTLKELAATQGL